MTMAATFTMTTMMMTKCMGIMIGLLHSAANSPSGMPPRDWVAYIIRNSTKSVSPERLHKSGPWSCPSLRAVIHVLLRRSNISSEEVGLLHDPQEFFLVDLAVTVTICLVDHLLELLIRHPLPKLLSHALQVLEGDLPRLVVVEEPECLQDLVLRVPVQDLVRHHLQELLVLDRPAAVVVDIRDHLLDLFLLWLETQSAHRHLQLLGVDRATAVGVKEVEGLLDLLLLLFGELLLLLPALVEAAERHSRRAAGYGREVAADWRAREGNKLEPKCLE